MSKLTSNAAIKDKLVDNHGQLLNSLNGSKIPAIHELREAAMNEFRENGFPTQKNEEWKYTNLRKILKHDYQSIITSVKPDIGAGDISQWHVPGLDVYRVVIYNGFYSPELSDLPPQGGVKVMSLLEAQHLKLDIVGQHLGKLASLKGAGLTALNTAYMKDGVLIHIPKDTVIDKPVHILYVEDAKAQNVMVQPRNLFIAGKGSGSKIIESYHTLGAHHSFINKVTEIYVGENVTMDHYRLQNDNDRAFQVSRVQVKQGRDSKYTNHTLTTGGGFTRNDTNIAVTGENRESNLYGLYQLTDQQFADNHTVVDHMVPECQSNELYKGVLDGSSVGVFNGKVYVRQDAQKVNAFQSNRNILLSDGATVNTKPQLEIWADDVKCSHGATSGQLNEDELFYMQARGIDRDKARSLLVYAFAAEVVSRIDLEPLKAHANDLLASHLNITF